jgi:hypothetical protein
MPHIPMMMPFIMAPAPYAYPYAHANLLHRQGGNQNIQPSISRPTTVVKRASTQKLQNKKIEKRVDAPLLHDGPEDERSIRLALAALLDEPSAIGKPVHSIADSARLTTRTPSDGAYTASVTSRATSICEETPSLITTSSFIGDNFTNVDEESLEDESSSSCSLEADLLSISIGIDTRIAAIEAALVEPVAPSIDEPRIGIDIGGVLTEYDFKEKRLVERPESADSVRRIVEHFGKNNVFIVSKVRLGRDMHERALAWLNGPEGFLKRVGLPSVEQSVRFVEEIDGPYGKGVAAAHLGLSFFVDDTGECLESVFAEAEGNSRDFIKRFNGILFHFAKNDRHRWKKSKSLKGMSANFWTHYRAISDWSQVLEGLGIGAVRDGDVDSWNLEEVLACAPWKKPFSSLDFSNLCQ